MNQMPSRSQQLPP